MKTREELNTLKEEVEAMSRKLHELTEEELELVTGGITPFNVEENQKKYHNNIYTIDVDRDFEMK